MNPVPHPGGFWCCALRPVTQSAYIGYGIHHQLIQNRGIEICLSDRYIPAYREKVRSTGHQLEQDINQCSPRVSSS
ncbi:hypothetical protein FZN22_22040 [Escherichia coli]|uniref:Uncharacterized protein n=1 Tax=Escherichia coli TaxID=562 RepID=A0A8S7N0Y5_ECOLX|nr:hypothetical protein EC767_21350 [Escherichia coli]EEW1711060.1 hypothetical protein [Escherichia coli]EEW3709156.1 hypothetical protein [Escherichia coli]EEW8150459.1 hypothetical protein [Escherichia coli]EEW8170692.1 hypothetical protein [Escherichia coli]